MDEQTSSEKFDAIQVMAKKIEDNFFELSEILYEIKKTKAYRIKGYKTLKEYLEAEHNMSASLANKLISVYEIYSKELDLDEKSIKGIGIEKLTMIKPLIKDAKYEEMEEWVEKAGKMNSADLRDEVSIAKEKQNKKTKTLKDVYIEQYIERMTTFFNCSAKELNFKLGLYFQDKNLDDVKQEIKTAQHKYDDQREMDGTI